MRSLTPAERARRAAALGIVLPASAPAPLPRSAHKASPPPAPGPEKLVATAAMRRALSTRPEPVPTPPQPENPDEYARYVQVRDLLAERYRLAFSAARPLAVGIHERLREAFSEAELSTDDLKVFLRIWVRRKPYRAALKRGDRRVHLDGSDAGPAFESSKDPVQTAPPERNSSS